MESGDDFNAASAQLQIKANSAQLKLIRKDLSQIFSYGKRVVELDQAVTPTMFQGMMLRVPDLFNEYMSVFNKNQTCAIILGDDSLFPTDEDTRIRNEVTSLYYSINQFHLQLKESASASSIQSQTQAPDQASLLQLANINKSILHRSRLPNIELPIFRGDLASWPKFKNLFVSIIHNDTEIPISEKFHYLSTKLEGDPSALIAALTLDDANYGKAWDALVKKYDDKRLLAVTYLDKIFDYVPPKTPPTLESLNSFIRTVNENRNALKSMSIKDEADFLWLYIALTKLDKETRQMFEAEQVRRDWPTYDSLIDFIHDRCKILQLTALKPKDNLPSSSKIRAVKPKILTTIEVSPETLIQKGSFSQSTSTASSSFKASCCCDKGHLLYQCPKFKELTVEDRKNFIKKRNICFNCFNPNHLVSDCKSPKRCTICSLKHHTLLHRKYVNSSPALVSNLVNSNSSADNNSTSQKFEKPSVIASVIGTTEVLLGTAEVLIKNINGKLEPVRLVIDCGSQFSLITTSCAKRLGFTWKSSRHFLQGAGRTPLPRIKGKLKCRILSKINPDVQIEAEPLVVNCIVGNLPTVPIKKYHSCIEPSDLADPQYWNPRQVDFLLGNDLFMKILCNTTPPETYEGFGALSTIFGKVLMGQVHPYLSQPEKYNTCLSITCPLSNDVMTKFWESEEITSPSIEHPNDKACEEHFVNTHYRTSNGQYVVSLPFIQEPPDLSDSEFQALSRFYRLENKLNKNPSLKTKYIEFLDEYEDLNHMSLTSNPSAYVIPHHGVFKVHETHEPKIRVVFDASMKTKKGSLNDYLLAGPKLHKEIVDLILNFRKYPIAIIADLVKMFRTILLNPNDRKFQHILWRKDKNQPVQKYELHTITYGMTPSPYLAMRTLQQLKIDEGDSFPIASKVLDNEIYVDDLATGADNLEDALTLYDELHNLLAKGGFAIHKWASNSERFLNAIGVKNSDMFCSFTPDESLVNKILGMSWDPVKDDFFFEVGPVVPQITKRTMLSTIARLFDPMGFLAPVIFYAKILLQKLWMSRLDWDDTPDEETINNWKKFVEELPSISNIRIPRLVLFLSVVTKQIIGFCDASMSGYAAVVYLRTISTDGEVHVSLLKSKTRLAPIKTLSVPRLELAAAHLLVKLLFSIQTFCDSVEITSDPILFSDSSIVLAWLRMSPRQLQTYVSNRVSFILSHTNVSQWYHVPSESNPADIASRGLLPKTLINHTLWWNASEWLHQTSIQFPQIVSLPDDVPEVKSSAILLTISNPESSWISDYINKFSKYLKLLRTVAYILRFIANLKTSSANRLKGPLTSNEIHSALLLCIKDTQHFYFQSEFDWSSNQPQSKRLKILAVFQDEVGILRVGGRLRHSTLSYTARHPILIPSNTHLVDLIIDHYHLSFFHLGAKALQSYIQREFWIFRLRQRIKKRIQECLICHKMSVRPSNPFMGDLPPSRVIQNPPFHACGVDYAGPFSIKLGCRRNSPIGKAYLCLFVCMATKAVHLEVVSSLSTEMFLAAFDRFIGRRGLPAEMFSDCGSNFVGAAREITNLYTWLRDSTNQEYIVDSLSAKGIRWHFNPPYSPHFGGLWEAAVKSAKFHLYRVLGDRTFNFEELTTLFVRIEAILNSRPLCAPATNDLETTDYLSPGHFLIGRPLVALPEKNTQDLKLNSLSRWQLVQNSVQHIWKRWHAEYLQTLQKRIKWYYPNRSIQEGDLVLLYDPTSLPLHWKKARVTECFAGKDNIVRVVNIRDQKGSYRRSIHKLVPLLPTPEDNQTFTEPEPNFE